MAKRGWARCGHSYCNHCKTVRGRRSGSRRSRRLAKLAIRREA